MATEKPAKPIRLCHIVTSHYSIGLFRGQIKFFNDNGFEVWGVSAPGPVAERTVQEEKLHFHPIDIKRTLDIWGDLKFFFKLCWFLRRQKFDIVESGTAKAGMLGMVAAWLVGVPARVYTLRGVWFEHMKGLKRKIVSLSGWIPCTLAHKIFVICHELREKAIREGVISAEKSCVIGYGSSHGVDTERFSRNDRTIAAGKKIRGTLQIPQDAFVVGFVGRASIEKGVRELAEAFDKLHSRYGNRLHLLFVGIFDYMGGMLPETVIRYLKGHPCIKCVGMVDDVENYYATMNLLVMPSYREGFGNVNIEAAAMGVPVVASDIYGCRESVANGYTGILVEPKNTEALYQGIVKLIEDEPLRRQIAENGPKWASEHFDCHKVWQGLLREYLELYRKRVLS